MAPSFRQKHTLAQAKAQKAKESAVLILMYEKEKVPYVVFIERKSYKGFHSAQISLPGGKKEKQDVDFVATALREANEEIGIDVNKVEVLMPLTYLYIPVSNFLVYPFVAVYSGEPQFVACPNEVERIVEVKLSDLLNQNMQGAKTIHYNEKIQFDAPAYKVSGVEIWGATAMILSEFLFLVEKTKH